MLKRVRKAINALYTLMSLESFVDIIMNYGSLEELENGFKQHLRRRLCAFDSLVSEDPLLSLEKKVPPDCEPSIQCKPQSIVKTR